MHIRLTLRRSLNPTPACLQPFPARIKSHQHRQAVRQPQVTVAKYGLPPRSIPDTSITASSCGEHTQGVSMSSRQLSRPVYMVWILVVVMLGVDHGTSRAQGTTERTQATLAAWDTGNSSAELLPPEAIEQKTGWKPLSPSDNAHVFDGDAVIA